MRVSVTVLSHRGRVREENQDAVGVDGWAIQGTQPGVLMLDVADRPLCVAVCDGMGGHAGGAEASRIVAQEISEHAGAVHDDDRALAAVLQRSSDGLVAVGTRIPGLFGMGSTVAGMCLEPDGRAVAFNVGDSRAYRLVNGILAQLTVDDRADEGTNVLSQVLGGGRNVAVEPHTFRFRLDDGHRYLLCSDGLTDMLDDDAIAHVLLEGDSGDSCAQTLLDRAMDAGGDDNITIAVVDVQGAPPPADGWAW